MQTPSTLSIWLGELASPLALMAALLAFGFVLLHLSARARRARMNRVRAGSNEDTFVHSLAIYDFDPGIARTTFRYLQENQGVGFPIEAADMLDEDLGLGAGNVDESIQDLMILNERLYQRGLQDGPIVTVEDLVRFVQASPRFSAMAA